MYILLQDFDVLGLEEKPAQFWRDDLLVQSVCELLIEMMKWVKSKFCVNYFIPGNNMMDHLIDTDLSDEIDALWRTSQSKQLIYEAANTCQTCELFDTSITCHIELPAWIKRAFVIYEWINTDKDNFTHLFSTDLTEDLQKALHAELSHLYKGICLQQKSVSCINVSDKYNYILKSEIHL